MEYNLFIGREQSKIFFKFAVTSDLPELGLKERVKVLSSLIMGQGSSLMKETDAVLLQADSSGGSLSQEPLHYKWTIYYSSALQNADSGTHI